MNDHEIYDYDDTLVITNTRRKQLEEEALAHHGILGMKWGIRRYQNEDGSLTELGQRHYDMLERKQELEYDRRNRKEEADVERERLRYQRETDKQNLSNQKKADKDKYWLQRDQRVDDFVNNERERKHARKQFVTALAVGAVAVGGGIALHHYLKKKGQEAIDSPKLTDAITAGSEKVEDIMKGVPLTFGSKSNKVSFANKYDFGNTANRGSNTKSTFTFGEMLLDDVKKDIKSKKGFSIDHDDAERLRDFASSAPFREAQRGMANRRAKTIVQNIAAHEKAKKLDDAVNDTVTRIGSGRIGNPTAMMPSQKWTTPSWSNVNDPNRYTRTPVASLLGNLTDKYDLVSPVSKGKRPGGALNISDEQLRKESLDWLYDAQKKRGGYEKAIERAGGKIPSEASNIVDLLAKKAAYDTSVSNLGSDLDKTLKKFKHSNIGDAYDMTDSKLMHTAIAISSRRRAQLENRDDYLMHYGRKGMKWGEDIYAEDELKKRQISGQSQYAQQLQAEAYKRKYGTQNTYTPSAEEANAYRSTQERVNGARIREQQKKQREAIAKYGTQNAVPASEADMTNGARIREQQKKQREAIAKYGTQNNVSTPTSAEPRQKHDPTINVRGKQVNLDDIEKYKNYTPEQAKNEVQERAKNEVQERATDTLENKVVPYATNSVSKGEEKIKDKYEHDTGIRAQKAIYGDTIPGFTHDSPSRALIDNAYKKVDTIEQSDEYRKLFGDVDPNKKSSGKQKMAEENYVKSKLEQQYANEIQTKYDNGEIDEDEYNRSMQMMPFNVANIYSGHELYKRYNGQIPKQLVDQMGRGSPAAGNITYDEALKYDNRDRYGMIAPDRGVRIYNNATPAPKSIEERQQEDAKKEADMAEREAHKQKVKNNMEDLASETNQAIDNVRTGNTGNDVVDQFINAKNNRYKMMYDLVVPTKETNKTENRRLDTANESNSSPDRLKKKLKV